MKDKHNRIKRSDYPITSEYPKKFTCTRLNNRYDVKSSDIVLNSKKYVFVEWLSMLTPLRVSVNFYDFKDYPRCYEIFEELGIRVKFNTNSIAYDYTKYNNIRSNYNPIIIKSNGEVEVEEDEPVEEDLKVQRLQILSCTFKHKYYRDFMYAMKKISGTISSSISRPEILREKEYINNYIYMLTASSKATNTLVIN